MKNHLRNMTVWILFLSSVLLYNNPCNATLRYVNPSTGVDSGRDGSNILQPIKTLTRAGVVCFNGDTIFIRSGVNGVHVGINHDFTRWNNQDSLVYIMPYFGESVTLVGSGAIDSTWDAIITIESSNNVYIKGLTLINYGTQNEGVGLRVNSGITTRPTSSNIIIDSCIVNNTKRQGILVQGNYITVKNCRITKTVMRNQPGNGCDWDGALCSFGYPPQLQLCKHIEFKNNFIDSCWGEGIILIRTDSFKVQNNKVKDCYSQCIYVDNGYNGEINNNWLFATSTYFNRHCWNPPSSYTAPAGGIWWGAENHPGAYSANDRMVENIKIYNNFIYGTSVAFGWFHDSANTFPNNSYRNISIYYNTVYNLTSYECFYIDTYSGPRNPPTGCKFINNIIPKGRYQDTIRTYFTSSPDYYDTTKWSFKKNCFIDGYLTEFPSSFRTNNFQGNPSFINSNVNLPDSFKIKSNSICRDSGLRIIGIDKDYWYALRDSTPSIGFHEYGGIPSGINNISSEIPKQFSLSQNYPNPFNPTTIIKFQINETRFTTLKIYDILGKEIETLVMEKLSPGSYSIDWNASAYSSGVYFYRLQSGDFLETKQMILVK